MPPKVGEVSFNNEVLYAATVRVQSASLLSYRSDGYWGRFARWDESPTSFSYLDLTNHFVLDSGNTDLNGLGVTINPGTSFTGNVPRFKSVTVVANADGCGAFVNPESTFASDTTRIVYTMEAGRWYYVSLPFDIDISAIESSKYVMIVVDEYDGEARAANGVGGSWTRVVDGCLYAGKGYIMQVSDDVTLTFNAGDDESEAFTAVPIETSLKELPSEHGAPEAGWNFVGNPYPAYFDISHIGFSAPITVWNGYTYMAYSPADDELALSPLQPFFVQCPAGTDRITFSPEGRQTTADINRGAMKAARNTADGVERRLIDLTLVAAGNDAAGDRTRVVINREAVDAYEVGIDATKMMSTDTAVPQIWTWRNDVRYAINEGRQTGGRVAVGMYIPHAGEYTLSIQRAEAGVTIFDSLTGHEARLDDGGTYSFIAEAGTTSDRFVLVIDGDTDGIGSVKTTDDIPVTMVYYTIDGRIAGTDEDVLKPGLYIKKGGNGKAVKVVIR